MSTLFTTSPDGCRIAYDRCGEEPAIVLIHGGGGSRQGWHEAGWGGVIQIYCLFSSRRRVSPELTIRWEQNRGVMFTTCRL